MSILIKSDKSELSKYLNLFDLIGIPHLKPFLAFLRVAEWNTLVDMGKGHKIACE